MNYLLRRVTSICIVSLFIISVVPGIGIAYDISDKFSVEGTLTGIYQYGDFDVKGVDDADRGAAVFDLGANFHPTETDEFQVTLSFAAGNGLNSIIPFSLAPYADDLEDDLKDINGRNRDYLLEAWYKHTFKLSENMTLGLTGGIIDATAYIDDNTFANDETAQFMNDIFVNSSLANLPSYDLGGAVEFEMQNFSVKAVAINSRNDADRNYGYYALQLGYVLETSLGKGNYRIYGFTTSESFDGWEEGIKDKLQGIGVSADQELSSILGVFARAGWQDDDAAVDHNAVYSGGINVSGKLWGREEDTAGAGYAYLDGADASEIDNTSVFEAYVKFKVTQFSDITLDVQYVKDNVKESGDRDGFMYGIRMNAYF